MVCLASAVRCLSKSYIELPVAVFAIEIAGDILPDGSLERCETCIISGAPQPFDARLGEILVLSADRLGHIDILDIRGHAERLEHGADHIAETLCLSGADIEDAIDAGCFQQPAQNGNGVVHVDKIAPLIAVGDSLTM